MSRVSKLDLNLIRSSAVQDHDIGQLADTIGAFLTSSGSGPLRLKRTVEDQGGKPVQVVYLRERKWSEFFYEKLLASVGEIARIEADVRSEIDGAFSPWTRMGALTIKGHMETLARRISDGTGELSQAQGSSCLGVSVSNESPLARPCNFAILGATYFGSDADEAIPEHRPAKQAFNAAWLAREPGKLPAYGEGSDSARIEFRTRRLRPQGNALDHIGTIRSIPDDPLLRSQVNHVENLSRPIWKDFYLQCLDGLHGSGVMQPYPDGWERDASGGITPIYSVENLRGMVDAVIQKTSGELAQANGKLPLSVMFAVQDKEIHDFLKLEALSRSPGIRIVEDAEMAVPPTPEEGDDFMNETSSDDDSSDFFSADLAKAMAYGKPGEDTDIES